jgi:hypothetical protein
MTMAVVINRLQFAKPVDRALFERGVRDLGEPMRAVEGFRDFQIVQTGECEVVLLIFADSPATLDRIATEVGSPWMVEHVVPLLASPPERLIGDVIASV